MDPITAALVAGIAAGATEVGKSALVDAYDSVKSLIKRKFGQTELLEAIEYLEKRPESPSRQGSVTEEIASVNADKDSEILKEIERLVEELSQGGCPGLICLAPSAHKALYEQTDFGHLSMRSFISKWRGIMSKYRFRTVSLSILQENLWHCQEA